MSDSRLCVRCQAIFTSENEAEREFDRKYHYIDGADFIKAAERGCYFCTWTWRKFRRSSAHEGDEHLSIKHTTYEITYLGYDVCFLCFSVYVRESKPPVRSYFRGWGLNSGCPFPGNIQTALSASVRAARSLQMAKTWLEECSLKHPECQNRQQQTKLPSRLVRVWHNATTLKVEAKICRGDTLPTNTLYLSLSHCWGKAKFLTTTRENICQFELSLPVDKLSQTFQDALLVTNRLGFNYIWIDSLCVVQDDIEDWRRESSLMGEVYRNASCKISASAFANGCEGFMLPQRRLDPTPVFVKADWKKSKSTWLQSCDENTYWLVNSTPWEEISEGLLFTRAWTLQEQLLASRTLHFGEDQMFWECKRTFTSEVWPQGWTNTILEPTFSRFRNQDGTWQFNFEDVFLSNASPYRAWYKIVRDYSHRQVTFASDRLPALAGIASEFKALIEDRYLYGLWNRDLHRGLLFVQFVRSDKSCNSTLPPTWQDAPSWSWSSLHKPVFWHNDLWKSKHIDMCKIEAPNPLDDTVLRLSGMLIPLLSNNNAHLSIHFPSHIQAQGPSKTGCYITLHPDQWFLSSYKRPWEDAEDANAECLADTGLESLRASVVIMPVIFYKMLNSTKHLLIAMGLMLHAYPGLERGMYRRVGVVEVALACDSAMGFDTMMAELRAYQEPLLNQWYHETNGSGEYVISLV